MILATALKLKVRVLVNRRVALNLTQNRYIKEVLYFDDQVEDVRDANRNCKVRRMICRDDGTVLDCAL